MSQKERILEYLKQAGSVGMCSTEPIRWSPPILRTAARIADLKADGHHIVTTRCVEGDHGNATAVRYQLVARPQPFGSGTNDVTLGFGDA